MQRVPDTFRGVGLAQDPRLVELVSRFLPAGKAVPATVGETCALVAQVFDLNGVRNGLIGDEMLLSAELTQLIRGDIASAKERFMEVLEDNYLDVTVGTEIEGALVKDDRGRVRFKPNKGLGFEAVDRLVIDDGSGKIEVVDNAGSFDFLVIDPDAAKEHMEMDVSRVAVVAIEAVNLKAKKILVQVSEA